MARKKPIIQTKAALHSCPEAVIRWMVDYTACHGTVETTSSAYDESEQSVSKDEDTYTFLPPPEYRVSLESVLYE